MTDLATRSPFVAPAPVPLSRAKFRDPAITAKGERRAAVPLSRLDTLWFNTGTLCNLACLNCYIESTPTNDALVYLTTAEVTAYLDEVAGLGWEVREIGFTGGEPFMNPHAPTMIGEALDRGYEALVLTNAMQPMLRPRVKAALTALRMRHGDRLTMRVSLDHHTRAVHEAERGGGSWAKGLEGLGWLRDHGFRLAIAGRSVPGESETDARAAFARLFADLALPVDADDPGQLVLFPEMDARVDVPEITEACWGILGKTPESVMCASSRMVVKRRGEARPSVVACTLLPYDAGFDLGPTLGGAAGAVPLNHPHCAKFCVLGGASCSK
jgi:hypothetical protein